MALKYVYLLSLCIPTLLILCGWSFLPCVERTKAVWLCKPRRRWDHRWIYRLPSLVRHHMPFDLPFVVTVTLIVIEVFMNVRILFFQVVTVGSFSIVRRWALIVQHCSNITLYFSSYLTLQREQTPMPFVNWKSKTNCAE